LYTQETVGRVFGLYFDKWRMTKVIKEWINGFEQLKIKGTSCELGGAL